ncbi:Helix-turn-helix domain-containing protein [Halobacillus alkaliphilus]|uniref:Helix-turn-helix domain-containing protein n=1 Tax=Halobacillus alkaliphilus TaxID=396056 RepID=A0A1I2PHL0_9BACI|nr:helix-turn-helix domain-containing protein [Halobacillus alkaliphilus]SFG14933.1 Helix-turn-helix domain-containing protein [Halobacillus alkaliphilus]
MNIHDISKLQSFPSKKELDLRVRSFLYQHKAALSPASLEILTFIWRHSVKYPGVSFAKIETIEKATKRSRRTIVRAINTLEKAGLLSRIPTIRPNGKRGVNILVITPAEENPLPDKKDIASEEKAEKPEQTESPKPAKQVSAAKPVVDTDYLPFYIPKAFIQLSQSFLNVKDILGAWKRVHYAYQQMHLRYPVDHYITIITQTFKQAVFAKQNGSIKKTFFAYFYGGILAAFQQTVRKEVMDDPANLYYDWLNN